MQGVLEQRNLLEVGVQRWFQVELVDQGQLQLEGPEHGLALVRVALEQLQADARVAPAEFGHRPGHEGGPGGGEPAQPEPAGAQAGQGLQLTLGGGEAPEDLPGAGDQDPAWIGEHDAAGSAHHQGDAGLPFQGGDLLRHRRRRIGQGTGGGGEGAAAHDLDQDLEASHVQH